MNADDGGPFELYELISDAPLDSEDWQGGRPFRKDGTAEAGGSENGTAKIAIESLAAADRDIVIGTSDGHVIHYERGSTSTGRRPSFVRKRLVGVGHKPIDDLLLFPHQRKLVVLSDATLHVLELGTLAPPMSSTPNAFKGVSAIALDLSPGGAVGRFSFAKRRSICNAELSPQGLVVNKEVSVAIEGVIGSMKRIGSVICFADSQAYKVLDMDLLRLTPLFPHDRFITGNPVVQVADSSQFLVATGGQRQDGIGVFLSSAGDAASRGTLQWAAYPKFIGSSVFTPPFCTACSHLCLSLRVPLDSGPDP
ncbi:hypothetical protein DFJ74DRAFT_321830 [Hyaloraphidium curvatum]|nr:hypothetical protein DFJ74DRAFT_321830 [Hyaloraphidium curvatum]